MNKYEMMFIVKTTLDEEAANKVSKVYEDIIKSMKGNLTDSKNLGNKKLAYPIKKIFFSISSTESFKIIEI